MKKCIIVICLFFFFQTAIALNDEQLYRIKNNFDIRREQAFKQLKSKPLVVAKKEAPLEPGRTLFTREFSYSIIDFAFKSFWLNNQVEQANSGLDENTDYYTDNLPAMQDRDNFYWAADELCRIVEYFGSNGSRSAGLLRPTSEAKIYKMMWQYVKTFSKLSKAETMKSKTWYVEESENHHIQRFSTYWHFSKLLKELPAYKDLKYDDGYNASDHYKAWSYYSQQWLIERAKKGLFIEMANEGYGLETLKGIYNFYDFGDERLHNLSGMLLDLYWGTWAQEQIHGVWGGSKSRIYPGASSKSGRGNFWKMAWYYFGITAPTPLKGNIFTLLSSNYRPPLVVMDIALETESRGEYEIEQRSPGLAVKGYYSSPDYRLKTDCGGIVRYSYCTPDFIIGTSHFEALPFKDWTMISSQNRWQGVIFNGNPNARIYPQCSDNLTTRSYNQHWSVQHKGCLITQKLPDKVYALNAKPMRVFFSKAGLSDMVERNGWVFVSSNGAFAAVKCISKGYSWFVDNDGKWLMCEDEYSPVIIEVARKKDFASYLQFQEKILSLPITLKGNVINYHSIDNDDFTFYADFKKLPSINGKTVNLKPNKVFDSPYIKSEFNSGIIDISKGERKLHLDFTIK